MSQNRSTAVMQRRVEPHDSLDDFPTPPWETRALCEFLIAEGHNLAALTCREPAANRGHMVAPLAEHFGTVEASDVHDYGVGIVVSDFLFPGALPLVDFTVTNPPFRLAEQFIERAIATSRVGVAMIVRAAFLEGVGRFDRLFSRHQPAHVLQFTERVVMHKGKLSAKGSTATAYCWIIWGATDVGRMAHPSARISWIAPCRKRLERASDYPADLPNPRRARRGNQSVSNKLCRSPSPSSFRLMAVEIGGEHLFGETAGRTLREDIAAYRTANCRPLYAIFVRPRSPMVPA